MSGDIPAALQALEMAHRLNPMDAEVLTNMAAMFCVSGTSCGLG